MKKSIHGLLNKPGGASYNTLDLFSGIGGFSLGLEQAGFKTIAFCECDTYCQKVLAKHWPKVPCYDNVKTLTARRLLSDGIKSIDVICGGFPCQDISFAGKGAGIDGKRSGLWSEFARLIGEIRPRYAILENVSALLVRGLDRVLGDLAALRYDAEWHCIPASCVGLPQIRDRIWIIAYDGSLRWKRSSNTTFQWLYTIPWLENEREAAQFVKRSSIHTPTLCSYSNGVSKELGAYGNAVVPKIVEIIGRAILAAENQ